MKCQKCESEDIEIVSTVVPDGKNCAILKIVLWISGVLSLFLLVIVGAFLNTKGVTIEALLIFPGFIALKYLISVFITALLMMSFVPYRFKSVIQCVCKKCGNVKDLKTISEESEKSNNRFLY